MSAMTLWKTAERPGSLVCVDRWSSDRTNSGSVLTTPITSFAALSGSPINPSQDRMSTQGGEVNRREHQHWVSLFNADTGQYLLGDDTFEGDHQRGVERQSIMVFAREREVIATSRVL